MFVPRKAAGLIEPRHALSSQGQSRSRDESHLLSKARSCFKQRTLTRPSACNSKIVTWILQAETEICHSNVMDELADVYCMEDSALFNTEKPYYISKNLPLGFPNTNIKYELYSGQVVTDVRGSESSYTLDRNGFEYCKWSPPRVDWHDEDDIKSSYLPAVKTLVEKRLGTKLRKCEIFDWRMRNAIAKDTHQDWKGVPNEKLKRIAPALVVHVDQSPQGVIDFARRVFGDEAESLLVDRIRLVNVWLPLVEVVENNSLALCDGRTADRQDFLAVDAVGDNLVREILMAKHINELRFYYMSQMTRQDVCIFKVWDSDPLVESKFVPHCSFNHTKNLNPDAPPRESIECRVLTVSNNSDNE